MPFPDTIIYITSPVIIGYGIVRCGISENGEIQLLLVMMRVMALFLSMPAVDTVSVPLLSSYSVGDCHITRHLHVICHNIIGLIATVLEHILWH